MWFSLFYNLTKLYITTFEFFINNGKIKAHIELTTIRYIGTFN